MGTVGTNANLPDRPSTAASGFRLVEAFAFVAGAAIASIHLREATGALQLTGPGWALMWLTFSGIALTASGPFLVLVHRLIDRNAPFRLGQGLWLLLGAPWLLASLPKVLTRSATDPNHWTCELHQFSLTVGLGISSIVALAIIWSKWVLVPPETSDLPEPPEWSHRVGLAIAVAWPLQCGFGLVVLGSPPS